MISHNQQKPLSNSRFLSAFASGVDNTMSTNNNFEYVGGAGELAGTAYAQPKVCVNNGSLDSSKPAFMNEQIMTGMHRTTSSDALHHHHYRNQSATTIQAAFKGYQSRAQVCQWRRESLQPSPSHFPIHVPYRQYQTFKRNAYIFANYWQKRRMLFSSLCCWLTQRMLK